MLRNRILRLVLFTGLLALAPIVAWSQAAKPLTEKDITTLVEFGADDAKIAERIEKAGVAFEADDEAIARLKEANVSEAILNAVQKAATAKKSRPSADAKAPITYDDVLRPLKLGIAEEKILQRLEQSPTVFTLSAAQVAELKEAGASERLLKALGGERAAAQPREGGPVTDFAIVFDCSASMAEKTPNGQTKMAVAQKVVADLIDRIPNGLRLAFIVYGHDRRLDCRAVSVARPLARIDDAGKAQLKRMVAGLQPSGNTPIALALQTAGKELTKNNAFSGMVLVSDGKETCKGDPAAEAAALAKNPKLSFGIQVVGFDVKEDERQALEQIATAGHGKYFDAQTADELAKSLDEIARELKEAAAPPRLATGRRAIKFVEPKIDMPEMGEVFIVKAGSPLNIIGSYKIASVNKYGDELRVASPEKHDIIWQPKQGMPIRLVSEFAIPDRRVVEIKVDDYAGLVKLEGTGTAKDIFVVPTGSPSNIAGSYAVQRAKKFGDIMVVPVGQYDVYLNGEKIEEKLKVEAGKLHELQ